MTVREAVLFFIAVMSAWYLGDSVWRYFRRRRPAQNAPATYVSILVAAVFIAATLNIDAMRPRDLAMKAIAVVSFAGATLVRLLADRKTQQLH